MINNNFTHMAEIMKAASPHLDHKTVKIVSLFTSFMEFMGSLYAYNSPDSLKACEIENKEFNMEGLLSSIKPVCNDNERKMVDTFLNMMNAMKIMNTYNDIMAATEMMNHMSNEYTDGESTSNNDNNNNNKNNNDNMMQILKSMLPAEQVEQFENISTVLNAMSYDNNNSTEMMNQTPNEYTDGESTSNNDNNNNDNNSNKNSNNNNDNMMQILKSMLPAEQVEQFENISMVLNAMSYDNNNSYEEGSENNG